MRATLRKNGFMMFDITVKFSVGRDDLINVIAEELYSGKEFKPSRRSIINAAKLAAREYGFLLRYSGEEDTITERLEEFSVKAVEIVDKFFPELIPEEIT